MIYPLPDTKIIKLEYYIKRKINIFPQETINIS